MELSEYSNFIALSRYARYRDDLGRRETWPETVQRLMDFWHDRLPDLEGEFDEIHEAILNMEVMPSMRTMMTAGPALERDNVAGYNCSYLPIDHPRAFDELMYILLCGTGVGFSVERQYVNKLPEVAEEFHETDTTVVFADSKIGWASGFRELLSLLWAGKIPKRDYSKIRPAGARLKTFGGRASGPEPLKDLVEYTISVFRKAAGRKLNSLECHDICCKIADVVVVGGVRRSALISLSNLSDDRIRGAKSGQWWEDNPHRALANNSACYTERPELDIFMREWVSLYESKSGERGIFSRPAAKTQIPERRDPNHDFGTNPCSEIILRPNQFCNLSEVVVRPGDTFEDLKRKVRLATILGTAQSTLTDFRYLRKVWQRNTEEERLLGVSLTGIMDHEIMSGMEIHDAVATFAFCSDEDKSLDEILQELRDEAIRVNRAYASRLGINPSVAITCVKPSGTVSQLVDSASGIHPRFSRYYCRTVRADRKDPLAQFMIDKGFPWEVDVTNSSNLVFSFPVEAPEDAMFADSVSAEYQLRLWQVYQTFWCEHKPSMTCYYTDDEFLWIGHWIYQHFDKISGISFLPYSDHVYRQAPYQPLTEDEYNQLLATMPKDVDWTELSEYETGDTTTETHELACSADGCEVL